MFRKLGLFAAILVLIASTLACGINVDLPGLAPASTSTPTAQPDRPQELTPTVNKLTDPGPGSSATASLTVTNNASTVIYYLYISPSTSSGWGDDQLGSSTIPVGGSYTFSGITPGSYDLKAEDSSHTVIQTWTDVSLTGAIGWTVTGSGGLPGGASATASLVVVNNSGGTIFYLYVSPSTSSGWGDDRLGASTIPAGGSFTVPSLTPGTYDLKAEDSSHNVINSSFSVAVSGTTTWTVPPSSPGAGTASLYVVNNTGATIYYLYVSPSTSSGWGDDRLGASTIPAGGSFTVPGLTPGTYDLKAEDASHNVISTSFSVSVSGTTTWTVTSSSPGGGTASLYVVNNTGTTIFYLYVSPSTSSDWGDDRLGSSTIPAGGNFTLPGLAPGTYDLKAEDSGHNVISTSFSVSVSGTTTWTVTSSSATSLHVVNNTGTTIFYLYVSPSTSSSWGDDQLGSSTIPAGGSFTLPGLTPGTYDLKAEDSGHNVIKTWMGASLSGTTTWTVTP